MFRRTFFMAMSRLFPVAVPRELGPEDSVTIWVNYEAAQHLRRCILTKEPLGDNWMVDSLAVGVELGIWNAEQRIKRGP
jgi:hypothetical protein